jgi:hypothetical protein
MGPAPFPSAQAPAAVGAVQVTVRLPVAGQPADVSPSEATSESVTAPGAVQLKRVLAAVGSVSTPPLADH